ncbi:hypothetical protein HPB51_014556 [Rhipicephalus microplus]|uniref:Uncharacterized protein n=1 Tax=Rhipicephalus microplus TaxID=6941 RepID=A0A9J6DN42_RHIMP|nr:hypothetical protein HPB51_014556 [Rhipicephalus microplus]
MVAKYRWAFLPPPRNICQASLPTNLRASCVYSVNVHSRASLLTAPYDRRQQPHYSRWRWHRYTAAAAAERALLCRLCTPAQSAQYVHIAEEVHSAWRVWVRYVRTYALSLLVLLCVRRASKWCVLCVVHGWSQGTTLLLRSARRDRECVTTSEGYTRRTTLGYDALGVIVRPRCLFI